MIFCKMKVKLKIYKTINFLWPTYVLNWYIGSYAFNKSVHRYEWILRVFHGLFKAKVISHVHRWNKKINENLFANVSNGIWVYDLAIDIIISNIHFNIFDQIQLWYRWRNMIIIWIINKLGSQFEAISSIAS